MSKFIIDCTPTWESLVLMLAEGASKGNPDDIAELLRLAKIADAAIAKERPQMATGADGKWVMIGGSK